MKRKIIKILGVLLAVVAVTVLPLQAVNAAVDHGNSTQPAKQPNQQSATTAGLHIGGLKATQEEPANPPNEISLVGLTASVLAGALIIVAVRRWPSRHPSATSHHAGHPGSPHPIPSH
jgi:hypothetical protein